MIPREPVTCHACFFVLRSFFALLQTVRQQYIHLGFDVTVGQDIKDAIKGIKGTSVANLNPNRDRGNITN